MKKITKTTKTTKTTQITESDNSDTKEMLTIFPQDNTFLNNHKVYLVIQSLIAMMTKGTDDELKITNPFEYNVNYWHPILFKDSHSTRSRETLIECLTKDKLINAFFHINQINDVVFEIECKIPDSVWLNQTYHKMPLIPLQHSTLDTYLTFFLFNKGSIFGRYEVNRYRFRAIFISDFEEYLSKNNAHGDKIPDTFYEHWMTNKHRTKIDKMRESLKRIMSNENILQHLDTHSKERVFKYRKDYITTNNRGEAFVFEKSTKQSKDTDTDTKGNEQLL